MPMAASASTRSFVTRSRPETHGVRDAGYDRAARVSRHPSARGDSGKPHHHDATFLFDDGEVAPGSEGRRVMIVHRPEFWTNVRPGDDVIMCEGPRFVGGARVLPAPIR